MYEPSATEMWLSWLVLWVPVAFLILTFAFFAWAGFVGIVSSVATAPAAVSCQCDDCPCKRGAER